MHRAILEFSGTSVGMYIVSHINIWSTILMTMFLFFRASKKKKKKKSSKYLCVGSGILNCVIYKFALLMFYYRSTFCHWSVLCFTLYANVVYGNGFSDVRIFQQTSHRLHIFLHILCAVMVKCFSHFSPVNGKHNSFNGLLVKALYGTAFQNLMPSLNPSNMWTWGLHCGQIPCRMWCIPAILF